MPRFLISRYTAYLAGWLLAGKSKSMSPPVRVYSYQCVRRLQGREEVAGFWRSGLGLFGGLRQSTGGHRHLVLRGPRGLGMV